MLFRNNTTGFGLLTHHLNAYGRWYMACEKTRYCQCYWPGFSIAFFLTKYQSRTEFKTRHALIKLLIFESNCRMSPSLRRSENGKRGFKPSAEWMSLSRSVYWLWSFTGNEICWCLLMKKTIWIRHFILRRDAEKFSRVMFVVLD